MLTVHRMTSVSVVIIFFEFLMSFILLLLSPCPALCFAREVRSLCRLPLIPIKISSACQKISSECHSVCQDQRDPDQMRVFAATSFSSGFTRETHSFLLLFYKKMRFVQLLAVSSMTVISH